MSAEMAEYGSSVETSASREQVWKVWSDMSTWGEWNPNVSTMEWTGGFVQGSEGIMNTRAGQHHKMKLAEVQPGRFFALETRVVPGTMFRFNCRVEPAAGDAGGAGGSGGATTNIRQMAEVTGPLRPPLA